MNLSTKLTVIKGVGEKTAEQLAAAGLLTVGDLITFLPRKHEDFSELTPIDRIEPGKRTIKARCESISTRRVRRGMTVTTAVLTDDTGKLKAVWFNQAYRATQMKDVNESFYFSGNFEFQYNRYQLTNPSVEKAKDLPVQTGRVLPVYRAIKGLKSQVVRKILSELRPYITMLPETLPKELVKKEGLMSYADAILGQHFPENAEEIGQSRERLAFEELFQLLLASQISRDANAQLAGLEIPFQVTVIKDFVQQLPFALTGAQRRAAWQIMQDFEKATPMNRLLQGDVGAGKTVVAALAARDAIASGYQVAVLAPTSILAEQHAETLRKFFDTTDVTVALYTGSVKGKKRTSLLENLANGAIDIVVGTHALLEPGVLFHNLGFVVIDEQHRFGVAQRQKLLDKSEHLPHLLSMTATPIPRSLQLTVFGELDVSVLDELPPGRQAITTKIWAPVSRKQLYEMIDKEIENGRQAYVVTPLIDENPTLEQKSAETEYKRLEKTIFRHRRIALLHGRMKPDEKDAVMRDFKAGRYDILVSTTVIEVGVDVPNATVMLIENADRFGLSQLHQLRGRVGRGAHQSYCYLMMSDSSKPSQRLREIEKSQDGFYLAEVDLKLRGPGEIYGRAQHGELNLQVATLGDTRLIARAQKAAKWFAQSDESLAAYPALAHEIEHYLRLTTLN